MARPQPIVIPGSMSTSQYTAPNLLEALQGLNLLAGLYKGTIGEQQKQATEAAGIKALASQLGMDRTPGTVAETQTQAPTVLAGEPGPGMGQDQGSFLVNLPQPSGIDLDALTKSELGRKIIGNMAEKKFAGEVKAPEYAAIETAEGPVTYNKLTGQRGSILGSPKAAKEFNIPGDLDSYLAGEAGRFGQDYSTPEGRMTMLTLFGDEKSGLKAKFPAWKQSMGLPMFNVVPTGEGLVSFNARTGQPVGNTGYNKPETPEMITTNQQIGTLKGTLDRVKELYNPDWVGPAAGRVGSLKESTVGLPPEQAAFYSNLEDIKNSLIYLKSGKQINESEYQRLIKQLPDRNLPESVFDARMTEFERVMNSIVEERAKASGGYGTTKTPKAKPQSSPNKPKPSMNENLRKKYGY